MATTGVYRVVGDIISAAGGTPWDPEEDAGRLEAVGLSGLYELNIENVPPGTYEFKVCRNGSWQQSVGAKAQFYPGCPNESLDLDRPANNVNITYHAASHTIGVDVHWEGEKSSLEEVEDGDEMAGTFETIHPAKVEIPTVTDSSYLSAMAGPVHSSTPTSALAPSMLMSSPLPVDVSSSVDGSSFGSPYGDFSDIAFDRSMQRPNQAAVHTPVRSDVDVIITPPTATKSTDPAMIPIVLEVKTKPRGWALCQPIVDCFCLRPATAA